ncbi:MAG: hypothetical protein ACLS60_04280 [Coprococcus phoceensis]
MTWPFENNTNGIVKNLAKRNLKSEKRRNIMVIISVNCFPSSRQLKK